MAQLKPQDKIGIPLAEGERVYFPAEVDGKVTLKEGTIESFKYDGTFILTVSEFIRNEKDINQTKFKKGEDFKVQDIDCVNITEILMACPEFE